MTGHIEVAGSWKDISAASINVNGSWEIVDIGYVKVNGEWKQWLGTSGPVPFIAAANSIIIYSESSIALDDLAIYVAYDDGLLHRQTAILRDGRGSLLGNSVETPSYNTASYKSFSLAADGRLWWSSVQAIHELYSNLSFQDGMRKSSAYDLGNTTGEASYNFNPLTGGTEPSLLSSASRVSFMTWPDAKYMRAYYWNTTYTDFTYTPHGFGPWSVIPFTETSYDFSGAHYIYDNNFVASYYIDGSSVSTLGPHASDVGPGLGSGRIYHVGAFDSATTLIWAYDIYLGTQWMKETTGFNVNAHASMRYDVDTDRLYILNDDQLVCLDGSTGDLIWARGIQIDGQGFSHSTTNMLIADDLLYFGGSNNNWRSAIFAYPTDASITGNWVVNGVSVSIGSLASFSVSDATVITVSSRTNTYSTAADSSLTDEPAPTIAYLDDPLSSITI